MAQTPEVINLASPPLLRPMIVNGVLDSTWQRWFIDLWNRTGGPSGDNIYDALISSQISDIENRLNTRLGDFENIISAAIAQFVLNNQQEVQDIISRISLVDQTVNIIGDETSASLIGLLQQAVAAAPVQSVFGRTGDVVAVEGDYDLDELGDVTLSAPAANQVLKYNGSAWVNDAVPAGALSGTVPVANGGTGASTLTANNVILGNGTSAVTFVAPGTAGNILTSNGTTWFSVAGPVLAPTYEEFVATAAQTVFNTAINTTAKSGVYSYLQVFVNGVFKQEGATKAFTVTGANQITFNVALVLNDDVVMYSFA